jgi:hypothetical protein
MELVKAGNYSDLYVKIHFVQRSKHTPTGIGKLGLVHLCEDVITVFLRFILNTEIHPVNRTYNF